MILLSLALTQVALGDLAMRDHRQRLSEMRPPADLLRYSHRVVGKKFILEYQVSSPDGQIPFGVIHAWSLKVFNKKNQPVRRAVLSIDPVMSQHSHGMTTDLKVKERQPGVYQVLGMKFHMPGWWTIPIDIRAGNLNEELGFQVMVQKSVVNSEVPPEKNLDLLRSLWVGSLRKLTPTDFLSNPYALKPGAAAFGKALFSDKTLSKDQQTSCAKCHLADHAFADNKTTLVAGHGIRKVPSLIGVAWQDWFFWDGRKDSLWSQALAPIENEAEIGLPRGEWVKRVLAKYPKEYKNIFGAPNHQSVDTIFANTGKAIAAYEVTLAPESSPFDRYAEAMLKASPTPEAIEGFGACEKAGLNLFAGKARCLTCHNGPRFENHTFHNTGVPMLPEDLTRTRSQGLREALNDPFNCRGKFSRDEFGRPVKSCPELEFAPLDSPILGGAFKTPSLRNVKQTAPYMHGGQFKTLEEVIQHYIAAPDSAMGGTELIPVDLQADEIKSLACFLRSL